jgi:hypothetical protein
MMAFVATPGAAVIRGFEHDAGGSIKRNLQLWWQRTLYRGPRDFHQHFEVLHLVACSPVGPQLLRIRKASFNRLVSGRHQVLGLDCGSSGDSGDANPQLD